MILKNTLLSLSNSIMKTYIKNNLNLYKFKLTLKNTVKEKSFSVRAISVKGLQNVG